MARRLKVVVEKIDEETRCVADYAIVEIDPAKLGVGIPDNCWVWDEEFSEESLAYLRSISGLAADSASLRARRFGPIDTLSYQVHTGRELLLMLRGEKPMAAFAYAPGEKLEDFCNQPFAQHVASGTLIQRDFSICRNEPSTVHFRIYTLPGESWRADALMTLKRVAETCDWSEGMVRLEGALLGYTDSQNDEFVGKFFRKNVRRRKAASTTSAGPTPSRR
jgi:hypothetical protein